MKINVYEQQLLINYCWQWSRKLPLALPPAKKESYENRQVHQII